MSNELAADLRALMEEVRELRASVQRGLPTVLSKKRAAEELDISISKLRGMIRRGEISTCAVGETDGIPASEIHRIASTLKNKGEPAPRIERPRREPRRSSGPTEAEKMRAALKTSR